MSNCLPEFINGYEYFMSFADLYWLPSIKCELSTEEKGKISCAVSFIDLDCLNSLYNKLKEISPNLGKNFGERYVWATTQLIDKVHALEFCQANIPLLLKKHNGDLINTELELSELFELYLLDFEFWNKADMIEALANLIFYDSWENPHPFKFFIPPKSEWYLYPDSWAGYSPFAMDGGENPDQWY